MQFSRLRTVLEKNYRSWVMRVWLGGSLVMVLAAYGVIGFVVFPIRSSAAAFPYHYTIYFGVDRLGPWYQTLMPAYIATIVFAVNAMVIGLLPEKDQFIGKLTALFTTVLLTAALAGAVFVALLNRS